MAGRKQFDVDTAVDRATAAFWERGYADTSIDALSAATGLGRGSLYGTFPGGKDELFRHALAHYAATYGARYDAALDAHPDDPRGAVTAFLEVTTQRIADPSVPSGCLIAQSAMESAGLSGASAESVRRLVGHQRTRVRAALGRHPRANTDAMDELAALVVTVNQGLAVMSRAGATDAELAAVVRRTAATVAAGLAGRL